MKLRTFFYRTDTGWSVAQFPHLDSARTLVIVFAAPEYIDRPEALTELIAAYPQSKWIGCSTAGEIAGRLVNDASLSVAVLQFERSAVTLAATDVASSADSQLAGSYLAQQLAGPGLRCVFVLSDGLGVNGSELLKGLNAGLAPEVMVSGGLAGDGERFGRTWVVKDGQPHSKSVSAIGFYGEHLRIGHGAYAGWDDFGPERRVTRSRGNVLYELDGRAALALYRDYLGERAAGLPAAALLFPLSLREHASDDEQTIRTALAVDDAAQSMTFAGDIPRGHMARLMRADAQQLIEGASRAAIAAGAQAASDGPVLAVMISCVGRRLVLGERTEEEVETVLENLPAAAEQIGFYAYGELSAHSGGACTMHNQTLTLTTFSEA